MLHVAPAIVIVAAVAAPSAAARRPLTDAQRHAADAYVQECLLWTRELFTLGEALGRAVADVVQGRANGTAPTRALLKKTIAQLDAKFRYFKTKPAPRFAERDAFRPLFLDYLRWERQFFVGWIADSVKILDDKTVPRSEQERSLIEAARAQETVEKNWLAKVNAAIDAVDAVVNVK